MIQSKPFPGTVHLFILIRLYYILLQHPRLLHQLHGRFSSATIMGVRSLEPRPPIPFVEPNLTDSDLHIGLPCTWSATSFGQRPPGPPGLPRSHSQSIASPSYRIFIVFPSCPLDLPTFSHPHSMSRSSPHYLTTLILRSSYVRPIFCGLYISNQLLKALLTNDTPPAKGIGKSKGKARPLKPVNKGKGKACVVSTSELAAPIPNPVVTTLQPEVPQTQMPTRD